MVKNGKKKHLRMSKCNNVKKLKNNSKSEKNKKFTI